MKAAQHTPAWRAPFTWAARAGTALASIALFCLMAMTFADVTLRSTINNPIEEATELTRIFMAIIVFASLPNVSWRGDHIVVDLLDPYFGPMASRVRDGVMNLVCGGALVWPAVRVWQLAGRAYEYGDVTEYLRLPTYYIEYFIALATFATAVMFLLRGLAFLFAPHLVAGSVGGDAKT